MREPEWTPGNINRQSGDTTLKICGWCVYAGTGTYRYECMLSGSCNLLPSFASSPLSTVEFDTSCKTLGFGQADIDDIIDRKKRDIKDSKESIEQTKREIAVLEKIKQERDEMPPLPFHRRYNHFNLNDKVAVWIGCVWKFATVVKGYRHHDGGVSFYYDDETLPNYRKLNPYDNSSEAKDLVDRIGQLAEAPGCGISSPFVMLKSEYEWFAQHPSRFSDWIKLACERDYNGKYFDPNVISVPYDGGKVKEGDKVKIIKIKDEGFWKQFIGKIGEVVTIRSSNYPYPIRVRLNADTYSFEEDELEKIE